MWYSTRYALTLGIKRVEDGKVIDGFVCHGKHGHAYDKIGIDIFETEEEAKANAVLRAQKAIAAAKRKIAKLEKLIDKWSE